MRQSLQARLAPLIAELEPVSGAHYRRMTAFVERIGQLQRRARPGQRAPDFALPSHQGRTVRLSWLLGRGPLVLVFVRGIWCPYCRTQIRAMAEAAQVFAEAGIGIAVVTPEIGGRAAVLARDCGTPFPVLCDVGEGVALSYGCLYPVPPGERTFLRSRGLDLCESQGSGAWFLPLASVFGIGTDGRVTAVFGAADARVRPEPEEILAAMRATGAQQKD